MEGGTEPVASTSQLINHSAGHAQSYSIAADNSTLTAKEAALAKKEAELLARERDVASREAELKRAGHMIPRKNWPICFPVTHHDISGDIPREMQGQVRLAYWCYLVRVVILILQAAKLLGASDCTVVTCISCSHQLHQEPAKDNGYKPTCNACIQPCHMN